MFAFVAGKVYAREGICYLLTRRSARARALLIRERCEERACRGFVAFFLLAFDRELFSRRVRIPSALRGMRTKGAR